MRIKREKDEQIKDYILKYKYREKNDKVLMKDKLSQYSRYEIL